MKESKFYIFDRHHEPLCWEGQALEFDTAESAEKFIKSFSYEDYTALDIDDTIIVEEIFFFDGGYIDATNLMIRYDYNKEGYWDSILAERI